MLSMPGSLLPRRNSREAPPPVETREYCRLLCLVINSSTNPVVSPPQMMVLAFWFSPISSAAMVEEVA